MLLGSVYLREILRAGMFSVFEGRGIISRVETPFSTGRCYSKSRFLMGGKKFSV